MFPDACILKSGNLYYRDFHHSSYYWRYQLENKRNIYKYKEIYFVYILFEILKIKEAIYTYLYIYSKYKYTSNQSTVLKYKAL